MQLAPPLPPPVDASSSEDASPADEPLPPDILSDAEERPVKRQACSSQSAAQAKVARPAKARTSAAPAHQPRVAKCAVAKTCAAGGIFVRQTCVPDSVDAVMEVFCPPRLVPAAKAHGLSAKHSLDKEGSPTWDADSEIDRRLALAYVAQRKPYLLLLSPECRMYSILQRNCLQSCKNGCCFCAAAAGAS